MGGELRRVNAVKQPMDVGILAYLNKIFDDVRVIVGTVIVQGHEIGVVGEGNLGISTADLVATDMVESFLVGAVLIDGPGEELIEGIANQISAREQVGTDITRFRKFFIQIGGGHGIGRFIAPVERAVFKVPIFPIGIGLLITLQMV